MTLTKKEKQLLKSKTPEKFIDKSFKLNISSGRKAYICKLWLNENKRFTVNDIKYARNRHPYWKKLKRGDEEKKILRLKEHNYLKKRKLHWGEGELLKFMEMDEKDSSGNYKNRDHELARIFKTSIPGIQHIRRKINIAFKILNIQEDKINKKNIYNLVYNNSENRLRKQLKSLENKK
jgi:hypothetical protein